jgi:[ribosomal protein S5]-alanine N-acetyltransferase
LNAEELSIAAMIEQVELRPVQPSDAETLARPFSQQRDFLAPYDPDRPEAFYTVAGQRAELEQSLIQREADLRHRFLILLAGEAVGALSISNLVRGPFQSANLGYWVAQQVNGRGVGTQAVGEACRWAFGEGGLHRLEAGTLTDNVASQKVLERNGFERIGLAPRYLHIAGEWRDHLLFQRIAP